MALEIKNGIGLRTLLVCSLLAFPTSSVFANEGGSNSGNEGNPALAIIKKDKKSTGKAFKFSNPFKRKKEVEAEPVQEVVQPTPSPRRTTVRSTPIRRVVRPRETAPSGQPPAGETRYLNNEIIARFQLSSTASERNSLVARLNLTHLQARTFFLPGVTVHRYRLPNGADVGSTITTMENSGAVVNVQPNYVYTLQQDNAPKKLKQYANDQLGVAEVHQATTGSGARIAIIDTAVDVKHPEITNAAVNFFDVSDAKDENVDPHGTSIAGILGASGKLTGVAPAANLISIAAFSKDANGKATGNTWTILEALNVALAEKANILNLSFAGPPDPLLKKAFRGAQKRGMIPIAAAGNEGPSADKLFPAAYETVVAVTATNAENGIYKNANQGDYVDIAAPGVGVLTLGSNSGFKTASGTSMATAYVSGIAALALSKEPALSYDELREKLQTGVVDLGDPGEDPIFGSGLIDARKVVIPKIN